MKWRTDDGGWSPYLAGALVGVLAVVSALATTTLVGKTNYLGASTTFVRAAGLLERTVAPQHVAANEYYTKEMVQVDWQFMVVMGLFLGSLVSSLTDRSFKPEGVPPSWAERFGASAGKRALWAILVGMVGVYLLNGLGVIKLGHKPMNVGAVILGGILFGAGWSVMGFCPGTSVGALGEGRWHAIFAVLGMVIGAAIYAELYPVLKATVLAWRDFGKIGVPEVLGVSPWVIIPLFWAGTITLFVWFEKRRL